MVKARSEIEKYLEKEIMKIIANNEVCVGICDYVKDTYEIPRVITSDYISMRLPLEQASEFILFCLLDGIEKVTKQHKIEIDKFFTMQEFKTYKNSKYEVEKIKFPLRLKMIQVAEDQWIGKIDTKTLMQLRMAQLINYNVNAQRTMQKIVRGEKEFYKITINKETVSALKELFVKNVYIPTPFTLNIPLDSDTNFYYDEDKCELVIKSIDAFDISDGYHRYVTTCSIHDDDKEGTFNYNMELRIVNFSDDKVRQFIFQEDQKTKMKKVDSNSFNMNKAANVVVTRLNESPMCNLQGLISRNQGIINFGYLADFVSYFYFKSVTNKEKEKSVTIAALKELTENFNMITEYDDKYLEKSYSFRQLAAIMCMFDYFKDKDKRHMLEIMDEVIKRTEKLDSKKFYSKTPKKSMMNDIEAIIKEVE